MLRGKSQMSDINILFLVFAFWAATFAIGVYAVRYACRVCAGFVPSSKDTAIAIGWTILACIPVSMAKAIPKVGNTWIGLMSILIISLIISAFVLGAKLKHPDSGQIGFKKGGLVSLVWSGVGLGIVAAISVVIAGIVMIYGAMFSAPKQQEFQPVPQTQEAVPSRQAAPQVTGSEQQRLLSEAAKEIIARFPQLDPGSPMVDQPGIDYVISRRDAYIANGHEVDIALRMAANDYGEQLSATQQRESTQRYAQQITSQRFNQPSVSQAQPVTNDYIRRKNEPCQAKAVMTDEDIARCRGR